MPSPTPFDPTCPEFEPKPTPTPMPTLPARCNLLQEGIFQWMKLESLGSQVFLFVPNPTPRTGWPRAVLAWGPYADGKYCCAEGWDSLDASKRVVGFAADELWGPERAVSKEYFAWEMAMGLQNIFHAMIRGETFPTAAIFFPSPLGEKS